MNMKKTKKTYDPICVGVAISKITTNQLQITFHGFKAKRSKLKKQFAHQVFYDCDEKLFIPKIEYIKAKLH